MSELDAGDEFHVTEGDYYQIEVFRGRSLARAALAVARQRRVLVPWSWLGWDSLNVSRPEYACEDDGLTDELREFFEECIQIGALFYDKPGATRRRAENEARNLAAREHDRMMQRAARKLREEGEN